MKSLINNLARHLKPLIEAIMHYEAGIAARWAASAFQRLMLVQWRIQPQPEHFDHRIDLYFQWVMSRNALWLERGVFSSLALKPGGRLLEIACGDGFAARNFFSLRCREVIACDFDPCAIALARRCHSAPNITHVLADIRTDMPTGAFDNIVWDAAIEHFTPSEIDSLLGEIKRRLGQDGVLSGYTIVERPGGTKSLTHHEYEFKDKEDLLRFFEPHFKSVTVFETVYPDRHNLYFWASQGTLPFSQHWPHAAHKKLRDE